jgi:hypothetical protein
MQNYRHTSLLTVLSKIFQKAAHGRLCHIPHTKSILVSDHYDFIRGMYAENATLKLTVTVFKSVNQKVPFR